jgi:acyl-CoA thioester hydrolase
VTPVDGFPFATDVRVRFAETDAQGIAHNTCFIVWFEVARVEYLRAFAGGYQRLRDEGIEALVLETHARYLQPARFDDLLRVNVRCGAMRGARFRFEYAVDRDGELLVDGWTEHACVDAETLRPMRIPTWFAEEVATGPASSESASSEPASSESASSRPAWSASVRSRPASS